PGADARQIRLSFQGAENVRLDSESGDLVLTIDGEEIRQSKPIVYQQTETGRTYVAGNYSLLRDEEENKIGFEIGEYDRTKPLVIDPILVFSTYISGSQGGLSEAIAIDNEKNVYITGSTFSTDFPLVNPYQSTIRGQHDIFVTKINAAGNQILYSTFIGSWTSEIGRGIDVDAAGNAYVTGSTVIYPGPQQPHDFPTTADAFDRTPNGTDDAVLFKLGPAGNSLLYSTYFGADNSDNGLELKVNRANGDIYIGGTGYLGGTGPQQNVFPTTPGAYRTTCPNSLSCGYVAKFGGQNLSQLAYSTFITGGSVNDLAVDAAGNVYITGQSVGDLQTTPGAPQPNCNGCGLNRFDAYIAKINPQGSALVYATYLGGSLTDIGRSIAIDAAGNAYVTGTTQGGTVPFPTTPGAFRTNGTGAFVTKINAAGTAFVYSTFIGTSLNSETEGIAVDSLGRAHVVGRGFLPKPFKPFMSAPISDGNNNISILTLNPAGSDVDFCTFFGAGRALEIVADNADDLYVTGEGWAEIPIANAIQPNPGLFWAPNPFISKISFRSKRELKFDFDGRGRANTVVFRPQDATWYYPEMYFDEPNGQVRSARFGLPTDRLAPADYDGDGRTDAAVFRDGSWYILLKTFQIDAEFRAVQFGQAGDIPVPADYDDDGRADAAVFRQGVWYILQSRDGFRAVQFGIASDKPVPGDYDGDGKSDVAVFRDGVWYVLQSRDGFRAAQFGVASDKPVPGDYDADGKTDFAVYRDGTWYFQKSREGFGAVQFGVASDIPVPADYDRDGRADAAVYRDGVWYLLRSTKGFTAIQFGLASDKPASAAYA
ncbi:MAG: SBBP repeat-containing protein, partial [Acidobacteriota bacterium]|nr:SBBP repeat-containing protein [Acidobacteriota bacterium]